MKNQIIDDAWKIEQWDDYTKRVAKADFDMGLLSFDNGMTALRPPENCKVEVIGIPGSPPAGGTKFDGDKLRMDLIPVSSINALADVLTHGAKKYSADNWRAGFSWSRTYAALQRHLIAWYSGETNDPETGKSHLNNAMCNIAFLIEFAKTHPELDDRPKG